MFAAYTGNGSNGGEPPDRPSNQNQFGSFPQSKKSRQRNYDQEYKISRERERKAIQNRLNEINERAKEELTFRSIYNRDSEEEDSDYPFVATTTANVTIAPQPSSSINRKHRPFASSSSRPKRKKNRRDRSSSCSRSSSSSSSSSEASSSRRGRKRKHKKRRKRTRSSSRSRSRDRSSPPSTSRGDETLIYESSERGSRCRFRKATHNMKVFNKSSYKRLKSMEEAARLEPREASCYFYAPDHTSFDFDTIYKGILVSGLRCPTNIVMDVSNAWIVKDNKLDVNLPGEKKKKATRFHEAQFDPSKYENTFRYYTHVDDYIPLSDYKEQFSQPWELAEKEREKERDKEIMNALRREAEEQGHTVDEAVLKIKRKIRDDPKNPSNYLEFCKAEDEVFERDVLTGRRSRDRRGHNDRKLGILEMGIKKCARSPELLLAKIDIMKESDPQAAISIFKKAFMTAPNDLNLWFRYLDFIQYDAQVYKKTFLEQAFKDANLTLRGLIDRTFVSHVKKEGTEEAHFRIWIRRLQWMIEQGNVAEAIASIQASIEYSFLSDPSTPEDQKKPLFKRFWESGAPRLGDFDNQGGFVEFIRGSQHQNEAVWRELERKELQRELEEFRKIAQLTKTHEEDGSCFVAIERAHMELSCRPLRFPPNSWTDRADTEIADFAKDMCYVKYDDLILQKLIGKQGLMVLAALGMFIETENAYADWYTVGREFGLKLGSWNLPNRGFLILYRILWQIVEKTAVQTPSHVFILAKNLVTYASRLPKKDKPCGIVQDFINDLKDQEGSARKGHPRTGNWYTEEFNQVFHYLCMIQMLEKQMVRSPEKVLHGTIDRMLSMVLKNPNSVVYKRLALGYILMAVDVDSATFIEKLPDWLSPILGDPEITNAVKLKKKLQDTIVSVEEDHSPFNSVLPSMRALLSSILMNMLIRRRTESSYSSVKAILDSYTNNFKEIFHGDLLGQKSVSYDALLLSRLDWVMNHRGRDDYVARLSSYLKNHPDDFKAIRLGIELLKSKSGALLSHLRKQKNPFSDCWNGHPLKEMYQSLLKIAICNKNLADHPESVRAMNEMLMINAAEEADKYKVPYLWTIATSLENSNGPKYIQGAAQCRWSKNLHLTQLLKNGPPSSRTSTCNLMDEVGIKVYCTNDDLNIYREAQNRNDPQ